MYWRIVARLDRFLVRSLGANGANREVYLHLVGSVSSSVCSVDFVKPLVLLPHDGRDDQREQNYNRQYDEQLSQRMKIHDAKLTTWRSAWMAFGSIPLAFDQLTRTPTQESAGSHSSRKPYDPLRGEGWCSANGGLLRLVESAARCQKFAHRERSCITTYRGASTAPAALALPVALPLRPV